MTLGGWISMTVTISFVMGLFVWCCYKLIVAPNSEEQERDEEENAG